MTMTTYLFLQFVIVAWESEWLSVYVWKPCLLVLYYIIYIATTQNIHDCKMSQFTLMPTTFLKLNLSPVFINKGCFHDTSYVFELIILTCLTSYFSIMLWTQLLVKWKTISDNTTVTYQTIMPLFVSHTFFSCLCFFYTAISHQMLLFNNCQTLVCTSAMTEMAKQAKYAQE